MTAILLAMASATFLGAGVVITQFGLRHVNPLSGAAISIPAFTLVFLCASPFLLAGETIVWSAVPIFVAVGLIFPAILTIVSFASSRALGPVVTASLGNIAPLFSVLLAVVVLHEPLRFWQFVGLVVIVGGILIITVTRTRDVANWRTWSLLLPLAAALLRGVVPPVIKIGLDIWPSPLAAALTGYIFSTVTVLAVERFRNGHFIVRTSWAGRAWFAANGICNGIGTLLFYAAIGAGPIALVAPLVATFPMVTVGLSALVFGRVEAGFQRVAGAMLTVLGVVILLVG